MAGLWNYLPWVSMNQRSRFCGAFALEQIARAQKIGRVVVELLFRMDPSRKLKRRPDLAFVSAEKWPLNRRVPEGEAWDLVLTGYRGRQRIEYRQ